MGIFSSKPVERPFNPDPYIGLGLGVVLKALTLRNFNINIVPLKDDDVYHHSLPKGQSLTILYNSTTNVVRQIYVD